MERQQCRAGDEATEQLAVVVKSSKEMATYGTEDDLALNKLERDGDGDVHRQK